VHLLAKFPLKKKKYGIPKLERSKLLAVNQFQNEQILTLSFQTREVGHRNPVASYLLDKGTRIHYNVRNPLASRYFNHNENKLTYTS
jgi:hypothetical protein